MDFMQLFNQYFEFITVVGCLVVGWLIKKFSEQIPNWLIPTVVTVLGAVLNCAKLGVTIDNIVIGAFLGAASTGLHQVFTKWVDNFGQKSTDSNV